MTPISMNAVGTALLSIAAVVAFVLRRRSASLAKAAVVRLSLLEWAIAGLLAVALGVSGFWLYRDAVTGYHGGVVAVWVFAAVGSVGVVYLAYFFARYFSGQR